MLVGAGLALGLSAAEGGYFPTSWGWASAIGLLGIGIWLALSATTDAGRRDVAFLALLALLVAWIGVSIAWSTVPAQSVLEFQRAFVLLTGTTVVLALARRSDATRLAGGLLAAISSLSAYAVATRLFPDRLGSFDPVAVYRLSDPIGYWNGLGIFAVLGLLLVLGVAPSSTGRWGRALAAASTPVLALTLYFTFSRGSWIALGLGFATVMGVSPTRLRTLAWSVLLAVPAAATIVVASQMHALTRLNSTLPDAVSEGRRLALAVLLMMAASAMAALGLHSIEPRVRAPRTLRITLGVVGALVVMAGAAVLVDRFGDPTAMAERAWRAFDSSSVTTIDDLNQRLFSFSGSGRAHVWRGAVDLYAEHRTLGSGAGTFERAWKARDDTAFKVRDAHGLYVETLAELGPIGVALLLGALLVPIVAGVAARRTAVVPGALGAYAAFLVHAGVDWDWELAGVTLSALLIGCVLIVASRQSESRRIPRTTRGVGVAAASVLGVLVLAAQVGNSALAEAESAVRQGEFERAIDEADRARAFMPWSPQPWLVRGEALSSAGASAEAARSFRRAIEIDPGEWRAWAELALVVDGRESTQALARARELYPRNRELEEIARRG